MFNNITKFRTWLLNDAGRLTSGVFRSLSSWSWLISEVESPSKLQANASFCDKLDSNKFWDLSSAVILASSTHKSSDFKFTWIQSKFNEYFTLIRHTWFSIGKFFFPLKTEHFSSPNLIVVEESNWIKFQDMSIRFRSYFCDVMIKVI